jgi:hypothetical protein
MGTMLIFLDNLALPYVITHIFFRHDGLPPVTFRIQTTTAELKSLGSARTMRGGADDGAQIKATAGLRWPRSRRLTPP